MASSGTIDVQTLFSLHGRIALVTGAGSGVGSYVAHGFALAGAKRVYITGRRVEALTRTAALHPAIVPIPGDVSTKAGCLALLDAFEKLERASGVHGPISLDVLVNNAGIFSKDGAWDKDASAEAVSAALLQADDEHWSQVFAVNVASLQFMSAAFLPHLARAAYSANGKSEGRGCIINNTSIAALYTSRWSQTHIYSASKAAAESLSQNLASKLTALGVRVNSIAIGNIPSELNDISNPNSMISRRGGAVPIGRVGNEEDMVGAVVYLASRAGSFVSGACLKIEGGILVGAQ
ncbi:NAD(P)-binding protein [Peniophora sp. CONT]|nr:NAD(P)-binding protein [Peniophora sp. CONT]